MPRHILKARLCDAALGPGGYEAGAQAVRREVALEPRTGGEPLHEPRDIASVDPLRLEFTSERERAKDWPVDDPCRGKPIS